MTTTVLGPNNAAVEGAPTSEVRRGSNANPLLGALSAIEPRSFVRSTEELPHPGHATIQARGTTLYAMLSHEPFDPTPTHRMTRSVECSVNTRTTVGLIARLVNRLDLLDQRCIAHRADTRQALAPGVVARCAHPVEPTHHFDRTHPFTVLDKGERVRFRAEVNAMAFFNSSCSTLSLS